MTTEERLETVETAIKHIVDYEKRILEYEGKVLELVTGLHKTFIETQQMVAELRRDTQHNQRMWVRLAQKHGWLDDEDWSEPAT